MRHRVPAKITLDSYCRRWYGEKIHESLGRLSLHRRHSTETNNRSQYNRLLQETAAVNHERKMRKNQLQKELNILRQELTDKTAYSLALKQAKGQLCVEGKAPTCCDKDQPNVKHYRPKSVCRTRSRLGMEVRFWQNELQPETIKHRKLQSLLQKRPAMPLIDRRERNSALFSRRCLPRGLFTPRSE